MPVAYRTRTSARARRVSVSTIGSVTALPSFVAAPRVGTLPSGLRSPCKIDRDGGGDLLRVVRLSRGLDRMTAPGPRTSSVRRDHIRSPVSLAPDVTKHRKSGA